MRSRIAACTIILGLSPSVWSQSKAGFQQAYEQKQVFKLRAEVTATPTPPPFFKGAVEASANQIERAERTLRSIINSSPHSEQAYEAHDLLGNLYFRNGMYQAAFKEIQAALQNRPEAADARQMLPIAAALNALPKMTVVSLHPSTVHIEPRSIFLPLQINGRDAEFFFDTGAGMSLIGESEAKELGIPAQAVEGTMGDASGKGVSGLRVALVRDLVIGGLHLQNVPFIVTADTGEPWNTLPRSRHGIIGIPVLLAMKTMRWKPTGTFELGFPGTALHLSTCNLLFHNANPVIDVDVNQTPLDFTLDTGAETTDLNPAFAAALPALVKTGLPEKHTIEGLGGTTQGASVLLPSVTLQIGGFATTLKPAHVFTEHGNGTWAAGNLGMDLLSQSSSFTLDFSAMTLKLQ